MEKNPKTIQNMFGDISPWYDFLNHFFSMGQDHSWRRDLLFEVLQRGGSVNKSEVRKVLDLCCGTGDVAFTFARHLHKAVEGNGSEGNRVSIVGMDFSERMVDRAECRGWSFSRNHLVTPSFCIGDTLEVPFLEGTFDAVTIAFGLRNLEDVSRGISEMGRVLRSGGVVGILEFGYPGNGIFRAMYDFYFKYYMPVLGRVVTGGASYSYFRDSVLTFSSPDEVLGLMKESGFKEVQCKSRSMGIVNLFTGVK